MPFSKPPALVYLGNGKYRTTGPVVYQGKTESIVIPGGLVTDLASVPRLFWAWLPPTGVYENAAVIHDLLCDELNVRHRNHITTPPQVSARDTDGLFRRVMRECGVGFLTRWVMWTGVRWGALLNPARRKGWSRDAPRVLAITAPLAAAAAFTVAAVVVGALDLLT